MIKLTPLKPLAYKRAARELIDISGFITKSIAGNLRQNEVANFVNTISKLSDNQVKIKTLVQKWLYFSTELIKTFIIM